MCPLSDIQALRNMWKVFQSSFLRVAVCKDRESAVSDPFGESLIVCPKLALGRLFSKIIFKSSNNFVYLGNLRTIKSAVKVRLFGWLKGAIINLRRSLKMKSVDLKIKKNFKAINLLHYQCFNLFKYDDTMVFRAI